MGHTACVHGHDFYVPAALTLPSWWKQASLGAYTEEESQSNLNRRAHEQAWELQASLFACALLMPEQNFVSDVKNKMKIRSLESKYFVAPEMVSLRWEHLAVAHTLPALIPG